MVAQRCLVAPANSSAAQRNDTSLRSPSWSRKEAALRRQTAARRNATIRRCARQGCRATMLRYAGEQQHSATQRCAVAIAERILVTSAKLHGATQWCVVALAKMVAPERFIARGRQNRSARPATARARSRQISKRTAGKYGSARPAIAIARGRPMFERSAAEGKCSQMINFIL